MDFESELYDKLESLKVITRAGLIEMLLRLARECKTKIRDFLCKYQMHTDTVKQTSELLNERESIAFQKDGR